MGTRAGAIWIVAAAIVVPSALAQVVLAPMVSHRTGIPAGATRAAVVTCPGGHVAVSGGVSAGAAGVALLRAAPAGRNRYSFLLANPAGNGGRRATVSVACRKLRARRGAQFVLRRLGPRSLRVAPGQQRAVGLACPVNTLPGGSGYDLGRGGAGLSVRRITESLRGFSFAVRNSSSSARTAVLSANCITVLSGPGAAREQLRVAVATSGGKVDPGGRRTITRRCPRGWFSLAAGYSLPAPSLSLEGAAAVSRGGRWTVMNAGKASARVVLQLACGRLAR
jgi:hypothetical protein